MISPSLLSSTNACQWLADSILCHHRLEKERMRAQRFTLRLREFLFSRQGD